MRVLMTADAVGGVWTYALDLARGLSERGIEVMIAVLGPPPDEAQRGRARRITNVQIAEHPGRLEWMASPWEDVDRSGTWLRGIADQWTPDIVQINGYSLAALDFGVPTVVVAHSCVLSWWRAVRRAPWPDDCAEYRRRVHRGLAGARVIVAPTVAMAADILSIYRPAADLRVIHNGRDQTAFVPRPKLPLVFSAGRIWDEAKNIDALQRIAPDSPWPIYVAGEGGDGDEVERYAHLGRCSPTEVAAWMRRASIYALPARYEPFGLSVLEAALCECALILGDIPSLRELWNDAAWFVDPDDVDQLLRAIKHAARDGGTRRRLARRARERASEFTIARMAAAYTDLYGELLGGGEHLQGAHRCAS